MYRLTLLTSKLITLLIGTGTVSDVLGGFSEVIGVVKPIVNGAVNLVTICLTGWFFYRAIVAGAAWKASQHKPQEAEASKKECIGNGIAAVIIFALPYILKVLLNMVGLQEIASWFVR